MEVECSFNAPDFMNIAFTSETFTEKEIIITQLATMKDALGAIQLLCRRCRILTLILQRNRGVNGSNKRNKKCN